MGTRYKNRKIFIEVSGIECPFEVTIRGAFRELGEWYYIVEADGTIYNYPQSSIVSFSYKKTSNRRKILKLVHAK